MISSRLDAAEASRAAAPIPVAAVLDAHALRHSRRFLQWRVAGALLLAAAILVLVPRWWPIAALSAALACYGTWGLLPAGRRRREVQWLVLALAGAGVLAGLGGLALRLYTGDASSPYGVCTGDAGRPIDCAALEQAQRQPSR